MTIKTIACKYLHLNYKEFKIDVKILAFLQYLTTSAEWETIVCKYFYFNFLTFNLINNDFK